MEYPNYDNLPFNLALTLLAVFLISDIRSSSSSFTSEIEKIKKLLFIYHRSWVQKHIIF